MTPPGAATETPLGPLFSAITGLITSAKRTYPDILRIDIQDQQTNNWRLSVFDSRWSPGNADSLAGQAVVSTSLTEQTGELVLGLSDGSAFTVSPNPIESEDDPPNWELITPNGWAIEFGPGPKVQIQRADAPVSG